MKGYLALVLHGHLPFVRHPEHAEFLEERWLFEAITETYIPLLRVFDGWHKDRLPARIALTVTPTLGAMLADPLLQQRYLLFLEGQLELADKEVHRTLWVPAFQKNALFYQRFFDEARRFYLAAGKDLLQAFRGAQETGCIELITCAATHAVLPLLTDHPPSIRAQLHTAVNAHRGWFGRAPMGIWLPECAYVTGLEECLAQANLRWFITDTHGVMNANPRPRNGVFAPILTASGVAAFGRDYESAKQVWSRHEGYPGDRRYRDFYRDIGFDLDWDYLEPHLAAAGRRSFTGIKYYRVTGSSGEKEPYEREAALHATKEHATHFVEMRARQIARAADILDHPPLVVAPYDAELFGHWWFEGPEFLDAVVRQVIADDRIALVTPTDYLARHPENQVAAPSPSSWGEGGYWQMWLSSENEWVYRHLRVAQERMSELARTFDQPSPMEARALRQAGRELLLAQASDWPFILRTGTSPDYARKRIGEHLLRFTALAEQLQNGQLDEAVLMAIEQKDNLFPDLDYRLWQPAGDVS